ncbi:NCS2 family permease [Haloplasma contractile]|uniref:Xanthine-uracil permease family protein n=1 Tax=Haloplasma contractile SSD-17B TaxID=1033810 RepID=F7PWX1_9MOLU|nr:NCS2 family permease [Haloplasma contractile]ERJ12584.1 Xanthine-uracil permease family protein [Haloplasma contractile SSD-17B]
MFKLKERGTTIKREFIAGLTTFLSMAYILGVNPGMLSNTGMDFGRVFTATAIAAIFGTLVMALVANYPVALAPGMGMNAFFTFTICVSMNIPWQQALAGIFVSGIIFMILSLSGIREQVINAIPQNLKYAVGAGIGLFIAFIGFQGADIIVGDGATLVRLGDLTNPATLLAITGLVITIILYVLRVPASIFIGLVTTSIIGLITGHIEFPETVISGIKAPHFFEFINGFRHGEVFSNTLFKGTPDEFVAVQTVFWDFKFYIVIFTLLFIDFFDTAGTLVTVGERAGLMNKDGKLDDSGRALLADSTATVAGAVVGTSSTTSYMESLAGIEAGGRTGLTSLFTALFFFIALFFAPLFGIVTSAVTAPALIMVGILMTTQLSKIEWDDSAVAISAFLTIITMPLAYSIAEGIAVGFLFYPITMIATKRGKDVSILMYVLSVVFLLYFILSNTVLA